MKTLHFSQIINAPRETVYRVMIDPKTYPEWTAVFNPGGSTFEGRWEEGSDIRFIGPDPETGKTGGMASRIKENRPNEFISIEHYGVIDENGAVDTTSDYVKKWAPAYENYTFNEMGNSTELVIDQEIDPEYEEMFSDLWPKALLKLKEIAERS